MIRQTWLVCVIAFCAVLALSACQTAESTTCPVTAVFEVGYNTHSDDPNTFVAVTTEKLSVIYTKNLGGYRVSSQSETWQTALSGYNTIIVELRDRLQTNGLWLGVKSDPFPFLDYTSDCDQQLSARIWVAAPDSTTLTFTTQTVSETARNVVVYRSTGVTAAIPLTTFESVIAGEIVVTELPPAQTIDFSQLAGYISGSLGYYEVGVANLTSAEAVLRLAAQGQDVVYYTTNTTAESHIIYSGVVRSSLITSGK